jgi:hypothetical protein
MPNTTRGSRNVSNTPGQSITLLNSPFVQYQALKWAEVAQAALRQTAHLVFNLKEFIYLA